MTLAKELTGGNGEACYSGAFSDDAVAPYALSLSRKVGLEQRRGGLGQGRGGGSGNRRYHSQHCFYRFAGLSPSCMEGGMTGSKLDSIALWVLLMLLIMVPWALE
jgi:hypothetical protein